MDNTAEYHLPQATLLSKAARQRVQGCLTRISLPKDSLLIQSDSIARKAYIVEQGLVRAFIRTSEGEITFWFAQQGQIVASGAGYFSNTKGFENFQLMLDAVLLEIDLDKMQALFLTDIEVCNWARIITEAAAIEAGRHHLDYILLSPMERYLKFLREDAALLQAVPLKDIATYLGVSAVSLSRIRARIR